VAVPHTSEAIYLDVLKGERPPAEKPFGVDLKAAQAIAAAAKSWGGLFAAARSFLFSGSAAPHREGGCWALRCIRFHHSSDWTQANLSTEAPGEDVRRDRRDGRLGMHTVHPFVWAGTPVLCTPAAKNYHERPDGQGGMAPRRGITPPAHRSNSQVTNFLRLAKRLAQARRIHGSSRSRDGWRRKFSTKEPKTLWTFQRGKDQFWQRTDVGFQGEFPTITGDIFEHGFTDCFLQMWASFLIERAGNLGERFGCVTPEEAVRSHELFAAALRSRPRKGDDLTS
jgi:hypothetical protein